MKTTIRLGEDGRRRGCRLIVRVVRVSLLSTAQVLAQETRSSEGKTMNKQQPLGLKGAALLLVAIAVLLMPRAVEAQTRALVANSGGNDVTVIDVASSSTVGTVSGIVGASGVAVTPDQTRAYVTSNTFGFPLAVIDTATNLVIATFITGTLQDQAIAITPDGTRAYIGNQGKTVWVLDIVPSSPDFNMLVATVFTSGSDNRALAITPDGKRAYVTNGFSDGPSDGSVSIIDTDPSSPSFNTEIGVITDPRLRFPEALAITPDGTRAYVGGSSSETVVVVDLAVDLVVALVVPIAPAPPMFPTFDRPTGMAIVPDGTRAYLALDRDNSVAVIDTDPGSPTFNREVARIAVGVFPRGVAISPDGSLAYVSNPLSDDLSVIDTATDKVLVTIRVGIFPGGVDFAQPGPSGQIAALNSQVNNLADHGQLDMPKPLLALADNAAKAIAKGNSTAAAAQLNSFTKLVQVWIKLGRIGADAGQALIDAAQAIIDQL